MVRLRGTEKFVENIFFFKEKEENGVFGWFVGLEEWIRGRVIGASIWDSLIIACVSIEKINRVSDKI